MFNSLFARPSKAGQLLDQAILMAIPANLCALLHHESRSVHLLMLALRPEQFAFEPLQLHPLPSIRDL